MSFLLIALLLQGPSITPGFFKDGQRIALRSNRLALNFRGFSRTDMIEIAPAGRQSEPSVHITSAAIRNLILLNREASYLVTHATRGRASETLTFTPADLRQDSILFVNVPEGVRISVTYNGMSVTAPFPFRENIFLNDQTIRSGPQGAILAVLNERLKHRTIVMPAVPPSHSNARIIHSERPDLTNDERRILNKLSDAHTPVIAFEATVTDTGQVIEVRSLPGLPPRLPRAILEKLKDAAMRYSFEPYVVGSKAVMFTTTIALEMP